MAKSKRSACDGPWSGSTAVDVWLSKGKVKDKAGARAWAKAHKKKAYKVATNKAGTFFVVRLVPVTKKFKCYRYMPWVDKGRTRFLVGGNPKK